MAKAKLDVPNAFPECKVKLYQAGAEARADHYCVTRLQGRRMTLQAPAAPARHWQPKKDEMFLVERLSPDAAYRAQVRVIESKAKRAARAGLVVEQVGDIERIRRRKAARVIAQIPMVIQEIGDDVAKAMRLRTEDVNSRGARVVAPRPITSGHLVQVALGLGDGKGNVVCKGVVVRRRQLAADELEIGLVFVDLSKRDKGRLVAVLLRRILGLQ